MYKQKTLAIMALIFLILLDSFVVADNIIPAYIRGRAAETTYNFTFNFTSDSSCNNVLKTVTTTILTDINGIGFAALDISDLNTPPNFMCEYQNNVLIAAHIWNDIITNNIISINATVDNFYGIGGNDITLNDNLQFLNNDINGSGDFTTTGDISARIFTSTARSTFGGVTTTDNFQLNDGASPHSVLYRDGDNVVLENLRNGGNINFLAVNGLMDFGGNDLKTTGNLTDGTNSLSIANAKTAFTHVTSDGSDHTFLNQDVQTGASPTFSSIKIGTRIERNGDSDTKIEFLTNTIRLDAGGKRFLQMASLFGNLDFNINSLDLNFRMNGDTISNIFVLDGGLNKLLLKNTEIEDLNVTGANGTFEQDVTIKGTLHGGSDVKIAGINITNNAFMLEENRNSSSRFTLQNLNDSENASAVISTINDVGGTMSIGIGSSNFMIGNNDYQNITAIFSKSRGNMVFANFFKKAFVWLYNPSDDNNPNNLVEIMRLDEKGLNVTTYNTGNVIAGEIDSHFGQNYGAIAIGTTELFISEISLSALDLNGTFVTRNKDGDSNIKFAWVGKNDKVRLAIPKEGAEFAMYNPRSMMIGGVLGQAYNNGIINCTAQGYRFIDCATDISGADLGIQDNIEFWGSLFGGNGTWNVSDGGDITTNGSIIAQNVFLPQYIFPHSNETIQVRGANLWTNITFAQEETAIKQGITHIYNDNTNTTFTINEDGIYYISYNFDIIDRSVGASDVDIAGRVIWINGTEIIGSVFETDLIKQDIETELSYNMLAKLTSGDKILFQFTADDSDVEISTHGTYGDHPDSVSIIIEKRYN